MSRWVTNKDAIETAYKLKAFKEGDMFKCNFSECSWSRHYFYGWEGSELHVCKAPGEVEDEGELELEEIAAWKPSIPKEKANG